MTYIIYKIEKEEGNVLKILGNERQQKNILASILAHFFFFSNKDFQIARKYTIKIYFFLYM